MNEDQMDLSESGGSEMASIDLPTAEFPDLSSSDSSAMSAI